MRIGANLQISRKMTLDKCVATIANPVALLTWGPESGPWVQKAAVTTSGLGHLHDAERRVRTGPFRKIQIFRIGFKFLCRVICIDPWLVIYHEEDSIASMNE